MNMIRLPILSLPVLPMTRVPYVDPFTDGEIPSHILDGSAYYSANTSHPPIKDVSSRPRSVVRAVYALSLEDLRQHYALRHDHDEIEEAE